jgi:AraC-like DNA-binding protein
MPTKEALGSGPPLPYEMRPVNGIEDLEEAVSTVHLEPTQLKPGRLEGTLVHAGLGIANLSSGAFRGEAHVTGPLSTNSHTIGILLETEGANSQWSYETQGGDIALVPPNVGHDARHGQKTHWVTLALPLETILEHAEICQPHLTEAFWNEPAMYRPAPHIARQTVERFTSALQEITSNPDLLRSSHARDAMLDELIRSALRAYASGGSNPMDTHSTFVRSDGIVREAEEYLRAQKHRPVLVSELARHVGVSERSLHRAFQEVFDLPPAVYLRRWRLSQARRMLAKPISANMTVAQAGLHYGFWELGRFAALYRRVFGEYPAQTLRQAKQERFG